ncbi:hypothetical protein LWI29_003197 [Acer saccharum]|uniref:DUF4283 domain-containing protein n=1 Tax=Acer saccharum TaxID=4024 RepID=A0AA39TMC4_ACESA|nr:hypothetical protein LWI29_003197 [Acer saccharum]
MNWEVKQSDGRWLEYSAVGVLKALDDVSRLVKDMLNRGIKFNFYYLGDKNVLWLFLSRNDRDDFIRDKVLWSESFSSVGVWSPAITPQSRMTWVEYRGIPLDCWCEDFFKRLGWAVGEPLRIDEETVKRNNIAVGRVLVLIPYNHSCPKVIKVVTGRNYFSVHVTEDLTPVSYSNVLEWLGLDWEDGVSDEGPKNCMKKKVDEVAKVKSTNQRTSHTLIGDWSSRPHHGRALIGEEKKDAVKDNCLGQKINTGGMVKSIKGKEKVRGKCSRIPYQVDGKPAGSKGVLVLGEKYDDCWTTSSEESDQGRMGDYTKCGGDTSFGGLDQLKGGNIVIDLGLIQVGNLGPNNSKSLLQDNTKDGDCGSLNKAHIELITDSKSKELEDETWSSSPGNSISHVSATQFSSGIEVVVQSAQLVNGKRKKPIRCGSKAISSSKSHGMVTRKDRGKDKRFEDTAPKENVSKRRWNLEAKMAKVIDKRDQLGVINRNVVDKNGDITQAGVKDKKNVRWSLREDVAKVIEVGVTLEFDFNGIEESVSEEIRRRETEDEVSLGLKIPFRDLVTIGWRERAGTLAGAEDKGNSGAGDRGKASWPELVGARGVDAASTIERENPFVSAVIVLEGSVVDAQFLCTRVRVWVNTSGDVVDIPKIVKDSWPELVGVRGEEAAATIEQENPTVSAVILLDGTIVNALFLCNRETRGAGEEVGESYNVPRDAEPVKEPLGAVALEVPVPPESVPVPSPAGGDAELRHPDPDFEDPVADLNTRGRQSGMNSGDAKCCARACWVDSKVKSSHSCSLNLLRGPVLWNVESAKKTSGGSVEANQDKTAVLKTGIKGSPAKIRSSSNANRGCGSRFDILSEDADITMIEGDQHGLIKVIGSSKNKDEAVLK